MIVLKYCLIQIYTAEFRRQYQSPTMINVASEACFYMSSVQYADEHNRDYHYARPMQTCGSVTHDKLDSQAV